MPRKERYAEQYRQENHPDPTGPSGRLLGEEFPDDEEEDRKEDDSRDIGSGLEPVESDLGPGLGRMLGRFDTGSHTGIERIALLVGESNRRNGIVAASGRHGREGRGRLGRGHGLGRGFDTGITLGIDDRKGGGDVLNIGPLPCPRSDEAVGRGGEGK